MNIFKRALEFRNFYRMMDDIIQVVESYPDVNYRYLISPTQELKANFIPIFMNKADSQDNIEIGYKDGLEALLYNGQSTQFQKIIQEFKSFTLRHE